MPSYPAFEAELKHGNFVGELLFWTAVYNFPQEMITFLLSMLPDNVYKVYVQFLSFVYKARVSLLKTFSVISSVTILVKF